MRLRRERDDDGDDGDVRRHTLEIYSRTLRDFWSVFIIALRRWGDNFIKTLSSAWPFKGTETGSL